MKHTTPAAGPAIQSPGPSAAGDVGVINVEWLLSLASQHADDSGPEAELNDLQVYLRTMFRQLPPDRVPHFMKHAAARAVMRSAGATFRRPPLGNHMSQCGWLIRAAEKHGQDSEPDHEVGDLQDLIRPLWKMLDPDQQRACLRDEDLNDALEASLCERMATDAGETDDWSEVVSHFGLDDSFWYQDQDILDYTNAYRLQVAVRDETLTAHTIEPRKRSAGCAPSGS